MSAAVTPAQLRAAVAGSSFYAGMRILPRAEREAMFAIYGFCRMVDDIADDQQGDPAKRHHRMQAWRDHIAALYAGGDPGQAAFLAGPVRRFQLDQADFIAVIDGMQMDLDRDIRWPPSPRSIFIATASPRRSDGCRCGSSAWSASRALRWRIISAARCN